jgi:hypothetical protein
VSVAAGQLPVFLAGDDMVSDSPSGAVSQIPCRGLGLTAADVFEAGAGVGCGQVTVGCVERSGSAFPNASGGCCFGGVDEWVEIGELDGAG